MLRLRHTRAMGALALTVMVAVVVACADEPEPPTPSGVSTATPSAATAAATVRAASTPVTLTPEQVLAMTAVQLEPLLKAALVQAGDVPQATWRVTDVSLKSPTAAVKEAEAGDLTHNLGLIAGNCFAAIPVTDNGAMGVMRVFSIASAVQGTTIISAVFRTRDDMQGVIE